MYQQGITTGCNPAPLQFCPNSTTLRQQMAVFIVTSLLIAEGQSPTSFTYTTTPYFNDVANTSPYFKFVQKLKDLGITSGCSVSPPLFCPTNNVTNGQMAVFTMVAWELRTGSSGLGSYTTTPYYTDVPSTHPFFAFIQKATDLNIFKPVNLCGTNMFCPDTSITRGQTAVDIVRGIMGILNWSIPVTVGASVSGLSLTVDGGGCTAPCNFSWMPGSPHTIAASSPQGQYGFLSWSDGGAESHSVTAAAGVSYTALFQPLYTVTTSPYGLTVSVDGVPCTGGCSFAGPAWTGTSHTISAPSPQKIGDTPYVFSTWSDTGAQTHIITPSSVLNFTANFNAMSGNCYTASYGATPADRGAFIGLLSSTYRLTGNEVYMYSQTSLSGFNAGLYISHITTYYYRNGSLINTSTATSGYGSAVNGDQFQVLFSNSQYYLGSFQLGNPTASQNDHWATSPVCESLGYPIANLYIHYPDSSNTYVASKPTIVDPNNATSASLWYLGGAPSIDGYFTQTTLTGHANWGASPPVQWSVIQRPDKVSLSASLASAVTATSAGANASTNPGQYDWDVQVQVTTDGLPSDPFLMSTNAPWSIFGYLVSNADSTSGLGYKSSYAHLLYDVALNPVSVPITVHETEENCKADYTGSDWCGKIGTGGTWYPSMWDASGWVDEYNIYGFLTPPSLYVQSPLGVSAVVNYTQKFFVGAAGDPGGIRVGAPNVFSGMCVERNEIQLYQDHGVRPPGTITTPISAALCASGNYVN